MPKSVMISYKEIESKYMPHPSVKQAQNNSLELRIQISVFQLLSTLRKYLK